MTLRADFGVILSDEFTVSVSLEAHPGSTVALLGPNGAGKTTTVWAIAGLLAVDHGSITFDGVTYDDPANGVFVEPERRNVGLVFQDDLLFPHLDVLENVAFGLRSRGIDKDVAREEARRWLTSLGLAGLEHRKTAELSGGEGQRVALARALVVEPDLLLLDEPLSALDVSTRSQMRSILARHLDAFTGPRILITHDPEEAFLLAEQVYVIEEGRITHRGAPDEIRLRPKTRYAADLAGVNLIEGVASGGSVDVGGLSLQVADAALTGAVLLKVLPNAVSLHKSRPEGSPRNVWETTIQQIEPLGERARVQLGAPLPLTAELTRMSAADLGLKPGVGVWVSVKATELRHDLVDQGSPPL